MKKIAMIVTIALMFVFTSGTALAKGDEFGKRMMTHQHRIEQGIRSGALIENEVKRLYIFWHSVSAKFLAFHDNGGGLDQREARIISQMQDHMGRSIYKLKHNDVRR